MRRALAGLGALGPVALVAVRTAATATRPTLAAAVVVPGASGLAAISVIRRRVVLARRAFPVFAPVAVATLTVTSAATLTIATIMIAALATLTAAAPRLGVLSPLRVGSSLLLLGQHRPERQLAAGVDLLELDLNRLTDG